MAAGQGFKTFATGDVLTESDVNGYLMQGVLVFASAAARNSAITSPQQGQMAFLKDTNTTTYYTGSAWANLDTTGMVNPMTTTGDTIYSSSGSTPARLGIGSTGQVLTVAGGVPSWATPAGGGGKVLQVVQSVYSTTTTIATGTFTDTGLTANITPSSTSSKVLVTVSQPIYNQVDSGSNVQIATFGKILRGSTKLWPTGSGNVDVQYLYVQSNTFYKEIFGVWNYTYLDSPATTSSTTYKTQLAMDGGTTMQTNMGGSTITLMEIGA